MEQTDFYRGYVACATGFDGFEGLSYLKEELGRFEHSSSG